MVNKDVLPQYSSLNDPDGGANINQGRALVAATQGVVTHFPLDAALIAAVAAGGNALVEYFLQHRLMEVFPVLRGE